MVSQNLEVKRASRSEMMVLGRPCNLQISLRKIRARSGAFFASLLKGTKCAILVNLSTITQILSCSSDIGRSVMKSIEIESHGANGTSSGWSIPKRACRIALSFWQSSHEPT